MFVKVIRPRCVHGITKIIKYSVQTQLSISQEITYISRLQYYENKKKR